MTRPAWYGGNKIPDSYLKRFMTSVEDEGIPYNLRLFLDGLADSSLHAQDRRQSADAQPIGSGRPQESH